MSVFFPLLQIFPSASLHRSRLKAADDPQSEKMQKQKNRKKALQLLALHIPDLHLRLVVALHHLRGEILQTEGCLQGGPHSVQVGAQSCCLERTDHHV